MLSDDEDEDEPAVTSLSQRLTKFRPPAKAKPKRKIHLHLQSGTFTLIHLQVDHPR